MSDDLQMHMTVTGRAETRSISIAAPPGAVLAVVAEEELEAVRTLAEAEARRTS